MLNREQIDHADDIIYVSTWKHVHPPLALPNDLPQERAFYDSDRATFDGRRNMEYSRTWMLVKDDSTDNWETDRAVFELMDPNRKKQNPPPTRSPPPVPYFTIPVPAHCYVMLADCDDPDPGIMLLRDNKTLSFHYFHPNIPEVLMYPRIPPEPTGRASLEWYQIAAMRHRSPAMSTYGELDDIWDKMVNPKEDVFLTKADYEKILVALQNNIMAKGEGKRNVNWRAFRQPDDQRTWEAAQAQVLDDIVSERGAASSHDPPIPLARARAEIHPYLEEKGKGKGIHIPADRPVHREHWSRRSHPRRHSDLDDASEQPPSTHPSMPDLVEDEDLEGEQTIVHT